MTQALGEMVEEILIDQPPNEDTRVTAFNIAEAFKLYLKQNCPNCRELDMLMRENKQEDMK